MDFGFAVGEGRGGSSFSKATKSWSNGSFELKLGKILSLPNLPDKKLRLAIFINAIRSCFQT